MDEETSLLLKTPWTMTSNTKSRRRNNDNDDYSSLASTVASTAVSSPENSELDTKDNEFPVMDIDEAIDRLGMGLFQIQIIIACGLCFASDAMEYLLLSYLGVILQNQWNLSESVADFISAVVFLGALVGTLTLTPLGDKWGRRIVFGLTSSIISIFGIGSAFCTNYSQILVVRFLVGFGIGGLTVPYDTLGEFMPNSRRGKNMLSTSFFWISASLMVPLFAWLTVGTQNNNSGEFASWRAFILLCSLPSVVSTALGIWIVPESPRWLLTRGKHEHALRILRQAAAKNGKDPLLTFPQGVKLVDPTIPSTNHDTNSDGIQRDTATSSNIRPQHSDRICSMCANPEWRKISLLMGIQWYGLTFMYYGAIMAVSIVFSNIKGEDTNENSNEESNAIDFDYWALLIASSAEIVGLLLAILLVDRMGRVSTQFWAYTLGGLCLLLLGILDFYEDSDEEESPRNYLIVFAFLSRMFVMGATAITWLHTAELLPTRFRATGHGLANALGRIGGMTCPFIVSRDNSLRTIGIVMFSVGLVTALSVHQLPETVGKALGNFSVSLNEERALTPEPPHTPHGEANDEKFHDQQQDPTDGDEEEADKRLVSSFEIL